MLRLSYRQLGEDCLQFLLTSMRGSPVLAFTWRIGEKLVRRQVLDRVKNIVTNHFDASKQNKVAIVATKTHGVYRPQDMWRPMGPDSHMSHGSCLFSASWNTLFVKFVLACKTLCRSSPILPWCLWRSRNMVVSLSRPGCSGRLRNHWVIWVQSFFNSAASLKMPFW